MSIASVALIASGSAERQLKNTIIDEVEKADGKYIVIDLNKFSKQRIRRVCIQTPYATKDDMEEKLGTKIDKFNYVDDHYFILWIFTDQQPPMQIKFHRWRELNFGESSKMCISSSKLTVVNSQLYLNEEE